MARTGLNKSDSGERRRLRRNSLKSAKALSCRVHRKGGESKTFAVIDFNSLGLSVEHQKVSARWLTAEPLTKLEVLFGNTTIAWIGDQEKIKAHCSSSRSLLIFQNIKSQTPLIRINRISSTRNFQAQVMVGDLIRREVLSFKVENFSSTGMLLSTSPSNRHLMPGMNFENAQLFIPHVGVTTFSFKIIYCSMEDRLKLGVQYQTGELNDLLMAYGLLCLSEKHYNAESIYKEIRDQRLNSHRISIALRTEMVSDSTDYQKALEVRLRAYQEAGKLAVGADATQMADEFDSTSVIFVAKVGSIVMGTARILVNRDKYPMDRYFPGFKRSKFKGSHCEISRLAIDPNWKKSDLLITLFKACFEYIAQNDIENVYCVATDKLRPLYLKLGAHVLERGSRHPVLKDERMNLMLIKKREYITGRKMTAHAWEIVAEEVIDHLSKYGFIAEKINRPQLAIRKVIEQFIMNILPKKKVKS